jgi:hypothetical protein
MPQCLLCAPSGKGTLDMAADSNWPQELAEEG